jgi:Putative adhesin
MRITALATTALLLIAGTARAGTLEEVFDKTYDARPGALISLDNTNGAVIVRAAAGNRVHVHAVKHVESLHSDTLRSAMNNLRIEVTADGGSVKILTRYPKQNEGFLSWLAGENANANVTYTLDVPRESNLNIETVNGHIEVADVGGNLKLDTTNGRIEVARCRGAIDAETTNGRIHAELLTVVGGRPLHFETTNGGISVKLPRNLAASIDAATTNGGISTELPVASTNTHRHVLRGTINGGGAELKMRTTNGSISIEASN